MMTQLRYPLVRAQAPRTARLFALLLMASAALNDNACRPQGTARTPASSPRPMATVQLEGPAGTHGLTLELACSAQAHARGLMGRTSLAPADGMLFAFADEAPRTFWMHNTPLCLDLLFFSRTGALTCIIDSAEPMTDTPRPCALGSAYVVELPGGTAAKLRIDGHSRLAAPAYPQLCEP